MGFLETFLPILQIIPLVWDNVSQQFGYVRDLNYNVATLMRETKELKRKRRGFKEEVDDAESVGEKRLRRVDDWFTGVNKVVPEVYSIKQEFDRGTMNPFGQRKLGKRVVEKIKDVRKLKDQGVFDEVAKSPRQPLMQKMQDSRQLEQQSTSMETLEEAGQVSTNRKSNTVCICRRRGHFISRPGPVQFKNSGCRSGRVYKSLSATRAAAKEGSFAEGMYSTITVSEPILQVDLETLQQAIDHVRSNASSYSSVSVTSGSENRINS